MLDLQEWKPFISAKYTANIIVVTFLVFMPVSLLAHSLLHRDSNSQTLACLTSVLTTATQLLSVYIKVFINQVGWNSYLIKFYVQGLSEFRLSMLHCCQKFQISWQLLFWNLKCQNKKQTYLVHSLKFTQPLDIEITLI